MRLRFEFFSPKISLYLSESKSSLKALAEVSSFEGKMNFADQSSSSKQPWSKRPTPSFTAVSTRTASEPRQPPELQPGRRRLRYHLQSRWTPGRRHSSNSSSLSRLQDAQPPLSGWEKAGFIFGHLARDPGFNNVTRRPGCSQGPSGFLPAEIEGIVIFIGLFSKEKRFFLY